jgi:hypothetical protein
MGHRDAATEAKEEAVERLTDVLEDDLAPQNMGLHLHEAVKDPEQSESQVERSYQSPIPGHQSRMSLAGLQAGPADYLMEEAGDLESPFSAEQPFGSGSDALSPSQFLPSVSWRKDTAAGSRDQPVATEGSISVERAATAVRKSPERGVEGAEGQEMDLSGDAQGVAAGEYLATAMGTLEAILRTSKQDAARMAIFTLLTILKVSCFVEASNLECTMWLAW